MPPPDQLPPIDRPQTVSDYLAAALPEASPRSRQRLVKFGRVTINGRPADSTDAPIAPGDHISIAPPNQGAPTPEGSAPTTGSPKLRPTRTSPPPPPGSRSRDPRPPFRDARNRQAPFRADRPPSQRPARDRGPAPSPRLPAGARILYEDADLLVAEKPPGILTASPTPVRDPTLLDILKDYLRATSPRTPRPRSFSGGQRSRFGVIHRLDKEASGLLVFTKTDKAFFALKEEFRSKRVHRHYIALVEDPDSTLGAPGTMGTIQSYLKETPGGRVISIPTDEYRGAPFVPGARRSGADRDDGEEGGGGAAKLAVTHYRVLASAGGLTMLQVRLETGRKHQIRVHLSGRGHPIAGDDRYGARTNPVRRLALHAAELGFTHPQTGQPLRFAANAPDAFYRAVGLPPPKPVAPPAPPIPPAAPTTSAQRRGAAPETSWDEVADWYDELLEGTPKPGDESKDVGSDHYENVILPGALRLLAPQSGQKILDLACGQGILARRLAPLGVHVTGVEASAALVEVAQRRSEAIQPPINYHVGDARALDPLGLPDDFDAAACIMALANIDPIDPVFQGVAAHLKPGGHFVAVITHPAFRIPAQSSWGWDAKERRQYRRIDGYLSSTQHRIAMHPGADPSITTLTFHRPLQTYVSALTAAGLHLTALEEWTAQRISHPGPRAAEENRTRQEIPLFLALRAERPPAP